MYFLIKKFSIYLVILTFFSLNFYAQEQGALDNKTSTKESEIKKKNKFGDIQEIESLHSDSVDKTIILPSFEVFTLRTFLKKKDQRKYDRLVRNVKKVYPYAKLAGERMKAYAMVMETMTRKERKNLVRSFEEEIKKTHGQDLKKLTPGQGRILLKLIDRETGNTPYELIEDLRGSFAAIFWNITASFFDFNLKEGFDPKSHEEDLYIDEICRLIDAGQL